VKHTSLVSFGRWMYPLVFLTGSPGVDHRHPNSRRRSYVIPFPWGRVWPGSWWSRDPWSSQGNHCRPWIQTLSQARHRQRRVRWTHLQSLTRKKHHSKLTQFFRHFKILILFDVKIAWIKELYISFVVIKRKEYLLIIIKETFSLIFVKEKLVNCQLNVKYYLDPELHLSLPHSLPLSHICIYSLPVSIIYFGG